MKILDKLAYQHLGNDIVRYKTYIKMIDVKSLLPISAVTFTSDSMVNLELNDELYGDIRSSSTNNAYMTMSNSNNEFFDELGITANDCDRMIGMLVQISGMVLTDDGYNATNTVIIDSIDGSAKLGFSLFAGYIKTVKLSDDLQQISFEIWDQSDSMREMTVAQQNDTIVPFTITNPGIITDLLSYGDVMRYALKYGANNPLSYDTANLHRTSKVVSVNNGTRKITVIDGSTFDPTTYTKRLIKLGYDSKLATCEDNVIIGVDTGTNTVTFARPFKFAHSAGEGIATEHTTVWRNYLGTQYQSSAIVIQAGVLAGATTCTVGALNAAFIKNLIDADGQLTNVKVKIGTKEEHFTIKAVVGNEIEVEEPIIFTHTDAESVDSPDLYIDKGHLLSTNPAQPAYMWFENGDNLWDILVGLSNADGGKISLKYYDAVIGIDNTAGFANASITMNAIAGCFRFDSLVSLKDSKTIGFELTDGYNNTPAVNNNILNRLKYNRIIDGGVTMDTDYSDMINYCKVIPQLRRVDPGITNIWGLGTPVEIAAGATETIQIECTDPIYTYVWPMAVGDWEASDTYLGGGVDYTNSITRSIVTPTSNKGFSINVTNTSGVTVYLHKMEIYGQLYRLFDVGRFYQVGKDLTHMQEHGLHSYEFTSRYVNDIAYAATLAQNIVDTMKNNYAKRHLKCILLPFLEAGDTIRFYNEQLGEDFTGVISKLSHSITENGAITSMTLSMLVKGTYTPGGLV